MYCANCGSQMNDGAAFCPACGQPANAASTNNLTQQNQNYMSQQQGYGINQRTSVRQEETAELHRMIQYFSQKSAQYDEYDYVREMINPKYLRKRVKLLVWGIIVGVLGLMFINKSTWWMALLLLVGSALMIFFFIKSSNAKKKNYVRNCARYDELTEELYQHYVNYGYCLVSAEYTNPSNLTAILNTIESGRADTIKEAINILVEDAHRNNMESLATQTAVASAAAARGATAAAVFSAANFFK